MCWPLTVRVALDILGRRGVCGRWLPVAFDVLVTVSTIGGTAGDIDDARAAGGDSSRGGSSTSIIAGIGVFRRVCCWCVRGVVWRTCRHVGLLDGVRPTANLGAGAAATLGSVAQSTLCGLELSTLGGAETSSLWWGLLHTNGCEFSDGRDVLLFVCGRGSDELLERREGGSQEGKSFQGCEVLPWH